MSNNQVNLVIGLSPEDNITLPLLVNAASELKLNVSSEHSTEGTHVVIGFNNINDLAVLRNTGNLAVVRYHKSMFMMVLGESHIVAEHVALLAGGMLQDMVLLAPTTLTAFRPLVELYQSIGERESYEREVNRHVSRRREDVPGFMDFNSGRNSHHQRIHREQRQRNSFSRGGGIAATTQPRTPGQSNNHLSRIVEEMKQRGFAFEFTRLGVDTVLVTCNGEVFNEVVQDNPDLLTFDFNPSHHIAEGDLVKLTEFIQEAATRFWSAPRKVTIDLDDKLIKVKYMPLTERTMAPVTIDDVAETAEEVIEATPVKEVVEKHESASQPEEVKGFELIKDHLYFAGKKVKVTDLGNNTYRLHCAVSLENLHSKTDDIKKIINVTNKNNAQVSWSNATPNDLVIELGKGRFNSTAKKLLVGMIES